MPKSQRFTKLRFLLTLSLVYGCVSNPIFPDVSHRQLTVLSQSEIDTVRKSGLVDANNRFAWKLLQTKFAENREANHFLSPVSAALALQMALVGADGSTLQEIKSALGLENYPEDKLLETVPLLVRKLQKPAHDITLETASSLIANKNISLSTDFIQKLQTSFDASAVNVDVTDPESVRWVNHWAAEKTHQKIPSIVSNLDKDLIVMLLNAIYFKANWSEQFKKSETQPKDFFAENGSAKKVPMMRQFGTFAYLSPFQEFPHQGIILPYGQDRKIVMYLFLPTTGKKLQDLVQDLDKVGFDNLNTRFHSESGSLQMPRFTLEQAFSLVETLKKLGLKDSFDPQKGNFKRITDREAYLSDIQQKSFVEVNEEGAEAAVVTSIGISPQPSSVPQRTLDMLVDHPFLFLIRDQDTGQILFMGTVTDPQ